MARQKVERRLTAILAADVVGYSALVSRDEQGTLDRFSALMEELVDPQITDRSGRVIKTLGDGVLAEFPSVVDALACAIEIQKGMRLRSEAAPEHERLAFRIGINSADVVIDSGDILGDGVNVASRLEGLAEPGGICVSGRVHEDVQGRLEVDFEDAGEQKLKNMPRPVRVFRVLMDGQKARPAPMRAPETPDKASIAVLPFLNMSGDAEQEYFADALTEDIITALSRWRWFFVIARNSTFTYKGRAVDVKAAGRELGVRYVLEGSVRKVGARVRVTAQLIDAVSGTHVWADNHDRDLTDFLALQDDITEAVVRALEPAMLQSENVRIARKALHDYTALDCFHRGMWRLNQVSKEGYDAALALFREAVARDPELSLGWVGLSRILYGGATIYEWSATPEADLAESRTAAQTAIRLDPQDAHAYFALAGASLYLSKHAEALEAARKSVALNPGFAYGQLRLGQVLTYAGRPLEAIAPIERALKHCPFDPQLGAMLTSLALAHYQAKNYPEAVVHARAAIDLEFPVAYGVLAAALAQKGDLEEAQKALPQMLMERAVNLTPRLATYARDADRDHIFDGMRKAGIGIPSP